MSKTSKTDTSAQTLSSNVLTSTGAPANLSRTFSDQERRKDIPATFAVTTRPADSLIYPDAYIGQSVVVNSAPSAWKGILIGVQWHPAGFGVTLADGAMWTQADVGDIINPSRRAKSTLPAYHGYVVHVPLCTAFQPAGFDGDSVAKRGELPGDPACITLAHYAETVGQPEASVVAALDKLVDNKQSIVPELLAMVKKYADGVRFPVRAVASILASEVLRRRW